MKKELTDDWIENIIINTIENYNGRDIVIWGRYGVSDSIRDGLIKRYGVDIAFYIDNDIAKIDEKQVFSPERLFGKSEKYYVVIPIAFYPSIREKLSEWGYCPDIDYYYFCDCILQQEPEYYEDKHGNKIIGNYKGLKFAFSGFNSVIEIGENVQFQETVFYFHNNSRIVVNDNASFQRCKFELFNNAEMKIGESDYLADISIELFEQAEAIFDKRVGACYNSEMSRQHWHIGKGAKLEIGNGGCFSRGIIYIKDNAILKIGRDFHANSNYRIVADEYTSIIIGDDCMFSYDIIVRSNDAHSIFDIDTCQNVNSTYCICQSRKVGIGNHVWIGERVVILYDTLIGDGSIIGIMSLVKGKIPNNCIAVGIPARVIRKNIAWCWRNGAESITECGKEYIHYTEENFKIKNVE